MNTSDLYAFLASRRLGVLSTLSPAGTPQSALVGIAVTRDLEIIFDTLNSARKFRNLLHHPSAAFVIGWNIESDVGGDLESAAEITVQYEGLATELLGPNLARYQEIYFATWPECRSHLTWPGIAYFVVRPRWIRYSDYSQTPPLIEEFAF